eukprot:g38559.t1
MLDNHGCNHGFDATMAVVVVTLVIFIVGNMIVMVANMVVMVANMVGMVANMCDVRQRPRTLPYVTLDRRRNRKPWTAGASAVDISWYSVTYSNGHERSRTSQYTVDGTGNRAMASPDGINWTTRASAADVVRWPSVTYDNGPFVAVGYGNLVMTSPDGFTCTAQKIWGRHKNWLSVCDVRQRPVCGSG